MLPFDEKKTQYAIAATQGNDLMSAGKKSAMQRFLSAIQADEPAQAADALEAFIELCKHGE